GMGRVGATLKGRPPPGGGRPRAPAARAPGLSRGGAGPLLGISRGTLRGGAAGGRGASFTPPGGHRRFPRAVILALVPAGRVRRPHLSELGASSERMAGAYRRLLDLSERRRLSLLAGPPQAERPLFRAGGRRMGEAPP